MNPIALPEQTKLPNLSACAMPKRSCSYFGTEQWREDKQHLGCFFTSSLRRDRHFLTSRDCKTCLEEGPRGLGPGLNGTKISRIRSASSHQRGREDSARGFNPISANSMRGPSMGKAFVPEGRCDRSLARSAWDSSTLKSRPVGYGLIRQAWAPIRFGVTKFRIHY
jgi:hypothetical protein